ncbi:GTPase HflX [Fodinisporobacter ferrooxydans]|uniref:GTPase HflX n=1 Tax=Fodinisporobacter ferrooxydans TaxID=2901836 RepID=A0ABY4CG83_9BACL|nr:GTPase HflX [Alicyclobacillaceae bacterium MYW30-H2]
MYTIVEEKTEHAILIGLKTQKSEKNWDRSFAELHNLAETAGVVVAGEMVQSKLVSDPTFFIGKGKAEELKRMADLLEADVVIANQELTPVQIKNLEYIIGVKVIDRTQLILHIFAERARSKEGKLQVELAQLKYLLPRLLGKGMDMSRLGGGIGAKGPGETKLELDRRRIRDQIHRLEQELKQIGNHRSLRTTRRSKSDIYTVAMVGYTNAGKSTLFKTLLEQYGQGDAEEGRNRLFDTLETTTRKLTLPFLGDVILSDTVGFIQDLPHHLIQSFRSTLEEVVEADLLLHVVDASDPDWPEQAATVYQVLDDLKKQDRKVLTVFNKIDQLETHEYGKEALYDPNADRMQKISAKEKLGLEELAEQLTVLLEGSIQEYLIQLPYEMGSQVRTIHASGQVLEETYEESHMQIRVNMTKTKAQKFLPFLVP